MKNKSFKELNEEAARKQFAQRVIAGAPAASTSSNAATPTFNRALYDSMLASEIDKAYAYSQGGPKQKMNLANTLTGGTGLTSLNRGDIKAWNWDTARQTQIDNANAINALRAMGVFDSSDYAHDSAYVHLSSDDFLAREKQNLLSALSASMEEDEKYRVESERIQRDKLAWEQLEQESKNPGTSDPWYNMLYANYLMGDRESPFNFDEEDYKFQMLSPEEQQKFQADLQAQWDSLDFDTLTGRNAKPYESKTESINSAIKTIDSEIERGNELNALQASIRGDANYDTLSVFTDTYKAPEKGTAEYIFSNEPFINGYDDLSRFMNTNGTWAKKMLAADYSAAVKGYLDKGYDYLTQEELADYNALINAGRTEDAERYLELLSPELLYRRAMVIKEYQQVKATNPWLAVPSWVEARIQNVANVFYLPQQIYEAATGQDNPYSSAYDMANRSAWTGEAHIDWIADADTQDWVKQAATFAYKGVTGAADNAARLVATGFNPTASLIVAGLQSGSASLQESAGRDDMSGAAKIVKAIGTAAVEVGTEKIGLDALFGQGKKGALDYIKNVVLSEVGEETLNAMSEPVLEAVVAYLFNHEAEIMSGSDFWQNLTDTAITTALSSLLMGGSSALSQDISTKSTGKALKKNGDLEGVLRIAEAYTDNPDVTEPAKTIRNKQAAGKKITTRDMGKLVTAVSTAVGEKHASAVNDVLNESIEGRLEELGEDTTNAKKLAPVIRKMYQGQKITQAERMAVNWSDNATQVVKEMHTETEVGDEGRTGHSWKTAAQNKLTQASDIAMSAQRRLKEALTSKTSTTTAITKAQEKARQAIKGKPKIEAREFAYTTETASGKATFEKVVKKNGRILIRMADAEGNPVEATLDQINNAGDEGLLTILDYAQDGARHDMSESEINLLAATYTENGGDVEGTIRQFEDNFLAGYSGIEAAPGDMAPQLARIAYEYGKAEAVKDEAQRIGKAKRLRATAEGSVAWLGQVEDNSAIRGAGDQEALSDAMEDMTEEQRTTAEVIQGLAKELKVNIVLYEGKGENLSKLANGKYEPSTHTLYVDVNGGAGSVESVKAGLERHTLGYAMMRTLGHELTHHIESTSAEGYAKYKEAVKKQLKESGQSWVELVRSKIENAVKEGRKLTLAGAEAEVIADASEYMLQESSFTKKLDSGLYAKMKSFVQSFMEKVREIFTHITGEHRESAALRKAINGVKQYTGNLQELWDAALSETIQGGNKEMAEDDYAALLKDEGVSSMEEFQERIRKESMELNADRVQPVEQFSMDRDVEVLTDGLMAVHNIKGPELESTLKLGGFPMPSIAIIKAKEGHTMYGEYSVVFGKQTIDPQASAKNRVYGADAWTPVFPRTETEVLVDVMYERAMEAKELASRVDEEYGKKAHAWYSRFSGSDTTTETMDDLQNSAWNNDGMLAAYMASHGKAVQILEKDVEVSRGYNPARADMYNRLLDIVDLVDLVDMKARDLIDKYGDQLAAEIPRPFARLNANWKQGDMQAGVRMLEIFKQAKAYEGSGRDTSVKTEKAKDYYATGDAMRSSIDRADFNEWIKGKLQDAFGMQGIYNGRDRFTPSGDRRSFKQLHDEVTAANIVKAMASREESSIPATNAKGLMAAASSMYKSIAEIKADAGRLGKISDEEYNARIAKANNAHHDLLNEIKAWDYDQIEDVGNLLVQAAKKRMDAASIAAMLKRNGYKATQKAGKLAADLINQVQTIPSGYFEAKPARVVGFDEIKMIIAPDSMPAELATQLDKLGLPYTTYDGTDADRLEKLNAVEDAQFSMRDAYGNELNMSKEELEDNKKQVAESTPVIILNGNPYSSNYYEKALQYYSDDNNVANNPVLGKVRIEETGIEHLMDFLSYRKTALIPAIKSVIEQGSIVFYEQTHKANPWGTAVIAAKVSLDGKEYYMGASVRHLAKDDTRYYIHDAILVETGRATTPNKNAGDKAETAQSGSPSIYSILLTIRKYNRKFEENQEQHSTRDLPDAVSIREYLGNMEPTASMTETEKLLLKKYKENLRALAEKEKQVAEQEEIIRTVPFRDKDGRINDELTKAKNRYQIYRAQANRISRTLLDAERNAGFARLMATSQEVLKLYRLGNAGSVADAADKLDEEVAELTAQLKTVEADMTRAYAGQKTAFARGLFDQKQLNSAALELKNNYGSKMSVKAIADRLALAYGEVYADNTAEGARRFAEATRALAEDLLGKSKFRYKSEVLEMLANEVSVISLTKTDLQEIKNAGLTVSQYKRAVAPYIKVTDGGSDLASIASNAEYYGNGVLMAIFEDDLEGNLAMKLYEVISREKAMESQTAFEGMSEEQLIAEAMADIAGANIPMSTSSKTIEYLRKELLSYAGESATAAQRIEQAMSAAKTATARAGDVWRAAAKEMETAKAAVEYYRKLEEQRRLTELKEQKQEITDQLRTDYAKKLEEKVKKQREEYREREKKAREYRHTRDDLDRLRRKIGRDVKRLNTLRVRETDQKHVPQELQHVADLVMQTFTDSALGRLVFSAEKTASLSERYRLLRKIESDTTYYWDDEIEADIDNLQELGKAYTAIRDREGNVPSYYSLEGVELEMELLRGVDRIVSNVLQMIDSKNDAFISGRSETFNEFATKAGEILLGRDNYKLFKGGLGKAQQALDEMLRTGNMTPIYFIEHLDNPLIKDLFDEVRKGQTDYARIVAEGKSFVQTAKEKYHYGAWAEDGKLEMKTSQGHEIELTREEAAEIYAIAKREKANKLYQTEHLLYGGFQFKDLSRKGKGIYAAEKNTHQLNAADIDKISRWLTDEQKAYADELVGFLSTDMAAYGNRASRSMYGYNKFTEKYYIPFHTAAEQRFLKGDEDPQGEDAGTGRVKNSGFTHRLQHKANAALVVSGLTDTVSEHIHKMAAYAAMVEPIENMKRLLNHKVLEKDGTVNTIRALIGKKYGQSQQNYMTQLLKDLNGAAQSDERATDFANKMIGAFKRGAVMASASVVLQQPTAAARAMAYIHPKYFTQNPFYRPSKGTWDEMMKYSGTAIIKDMGKFDVGMGLTASQYIADENINAMEAYSRLKADSKWQAGKAAYKRAIDWLTAAPGKADQWTWGLIWKANKAKQAELHPDMDVNSEEFLQLCGETFDDVIDHTQVYDSVITRSNLMRSRNVLHKMATSFMSEPVLSLNMLYDAFAGKHSKKQRAALVGGVITSQVLAGALAALAQAWNDDEDKRNWLERYADRATGNILDNLNLFGMIPYVSDLMSLLSGYEVERPDMAAVKGIIDYSSTFFTKATDPEKKLTWKDYENFVGSLANMAGLPAKNISREIRRTRNLIFNSQWTTPDAFNVGQSMLENVPFYDSKNKTYYERIVSAELRGDKQKAEDYREYMLLSKMVSEDTLKKGLKAAMQEAFIDGRADEDTAIQYLQKIGAYDNEDDAYFEVDKWEYMRDTGNGADSYRKYSNFFSAVETGTNLKATIQEYLNNGVSKSTLAAQITSEYKPRLIEAKKSGKGYADLQARILTAYEALGYNRATKLKDIQKWFEEAK